jgi:nucleotide-binding universal stress UspA family protein
MPSGQPMAGWLSPEIEELHTNQVKQGFYALVEKAGIDPRNRHLTVGPVSSELDRIVKKSHARIVVMGAISRSALKRLFIGSTAERIMDSATYDILIIKPAVTKAKTARRNGAARVRAA